MRYQSLDPDFPLSIACLFYLLMYLTQFSSLLASLEIKSRTAPPLSSIFRQGLDKLPRWNQTCDSPASAFLSAVIIGHLAILYIVIPLFLDLHFSFLYLGGVV